MHNSNGNLKSFDQAERPIHLSTHGAFVRCETRPVDLQTRRTRYPFLVTCEVCRSRFSDQERHQALSNPNSDQVEPIAKV